MKNFIALAVCALFPALNAAENASLFNTFDKSTEGWNTPRYWNGTLTRADGRMTLVPTAKNGHHFGRCTKMILNLRHLSGSLLELSFDGAGNGTVAIGAMLFPDAPKKPYMVEFGKITLSSDSRRFKQVLDFSKYQTDRISLTFEIPAGSSFTFDNVKLVSRVDDKIKITEPEIPVMRETAKDIRVKTNSPGRDFSVFSGADVFTVKSLADGTVVIPAQKIKWAKDRSSDITVSANGTKTRFQTSIVPAADYDKNIALAQKIGKSPVQIVWFGDSELDFDRSRNTPAQVNFYLNAAKKKSSYFNFAVAGDSLLRVDARLTGRYAPRPEAYRDLGKARPDLVIIMLGHNDSMTRSQNKFADSQVPVKAQRGLARNVLRNIRTRYPEARILLVSPLALDGAFLKAQSEKNARGRDYVWFGSPEMMTKFLNNWRASAREAGVEFLDIYTPMSKIADRLKYFKKGDEVHLNASGHVMLTGKIMAYLAANPNWNKVKKYTAAESVSFKAKNFANGEFHAGTGSVKLIGKRKFSSDGALEMDGITNAVTMTGAAAVDIKKGFTLDIVCKSENVPGNDATSLAYDTCFYAPDSFVLTRYQRGFYMLYFDGKKYQRAFNLGPFFDLKKPQAHHIAMTCKYHEAVDQGEIWTDIQIFIDGKAVISHKLPKVKFLPPAGNIEFGASSRFGKYWNLGGKLYGGAYFTRILTEKEIRDRVLEFKDVVKPAFKLAASVPAQTLKAINSAKLTPAQKAGCINLAKSNFKDLDKVLNDPGKYLLSFGKKNVLTLLNYPGSVRVISLYDNSARRELFSWNNPLWEAHFLSGNKKTVLPMNAFESRLLSAPQNVNGVVTFSLAHSRKAAPAAKGTSSWRFDGKRLDYKLDLQSLSGAASLDRVTLPSLVIAPLDEKNTNMVIPEAGGLLYTQAVQKKLTYNGVYPRMLTSMQFAAVYDKQGGVYFSPADPQARTKEYALRVDSDGTTVQIHWPAAFIKRSIPNSFSSETPVSVEAFTGDWYDTGLLYRKELDRINALWWRKTLPNTDTPEWFRNNALNLLVFHIPSPEKAIAFRNYLECPYAIQHWYWWERGPGHHLCPIPRANAEYIAYSKLMKQHDISVISYTNGRLWSTKDCKGKATLYNTLGKEAAVKKADGSIQLEPYGTMCAVLCPASKIYQKAMFDMVTRLTAQGISGCFIDQLGAARPILCQIPTHGHPANDNKSWNVNGHRKAFMPIKEYWKKNNIQAVMSTEDNSEHCVGLVDAMAPWRWMYDHQIPLHVLVYSGRTQYISRDPVGAELKGTFPKVAFQMIQGEQMGHFGTVEITSPAKGNFRRFLKRLCHLRLAMIDYFNCGLMQRPPVFSGLGKKIYTRWGNHGTKDVGTYAVIASEWKWKGTSVMVLVNTTDSARSGKIVSARSNPVAVFTSSGKKAALNNSFAIEPYGCELRVYGKRPDAGTMQKFEKHFAVIRRTASEKDPFGVDKMEFPDSPAFDARKWQQSAASPIVLGARVNRDLMVLDNVFYGVFYAGIADFGKPSRGVFEVELSAPSYSGGGNIQIMTGHPDSGKLAASMILDRKNVLTDSWSDYRKYRIPAKVLLGGKHKLFFKLNGGSVCNFRNWRWIPGDEK